MNRHILLLIFVACGVWGIFLWYLRNPKVEVEKQKEKDPIEHISDKTPQPIQQNKKLVVEKTPPSITPELDRCTLELAGRTLKPIRIYPSNRLELVVQGLQIEVEEAEIRAFKIGEEKSQWTAKVPDQIEPDLLANDEKVLYFAGYHRSERWKKPTPDSPLRVRRLEIASGKWLDALTLETNHDPKQREYVQSVLCANGRVTILTQLVDPDPTWDQREELVSYQVICFKSDETKPLWSKSFPATEKASSPGVFLLSAAQYPTKVEPNVRPLTQLGEAILVCADPVQPILCLEGKSGKEQWRMERLWEYERGFIGPSVWAHFIGRFGKDRIVKEEEDIKDKDQPPDRRYSLIGGPIVVDLPKDHSGKVNQSIFVAVAKGPIRYSEYLSDCVVYELDPKGEPRSIVTLPRMVQGNQYQVQSDGIVWGCQKGALVKIGVDPLVERTRGFGPGSPDLLGRIDWYRHVYARQPEAWLNSGSVGDGKAFGDTFAFCVHLGGYVKEEHSRIYDFPISMIDLKTGLDRKLVLHVPYQGTLPIPESHFSSTTYPGGKITYKAKTPHILAITRLAVEGKYLRITLGMENWARNLEFEIDELLGEKKK